jgi:hypothetical protein
MVALVGGAPGASYPGRSSAVGWTSLSDQPPRRERGVPCRGVLPVRWRVRGPEGADTGPVRACALWASSDPGFAACVGEVPGDRVEGDE